MGRRKWTVDQKLEIVLAGLAPGANISAVCREYGILQPQYYRDIGKNRLAFECFWISLDLLKKIKKEHLQLDVYRQLAELYIQNNQWTKAKKKCLRRH